MKNETIKLYVVEQLQFEKFNRSKIVNTKLCFLEAHTLKLLQLLIF